MHVLLVSTLFPSPAQPQVIGGAEVVVRRLAEALDAHGVRVSVVRALPPGEDAPVETLGNIRIYSLSVRRAYWPFDGIERGGGAKLRWHAADDFGETRRFNELLGAIAPDVVHTHNIPGLTTGVWRAAKRAGRPIVHTLHDYYLLCPRTTRFHGGALCRGQCTDCRLLTLRRRRDSYLVDDIVGVSRAVLEEHSANGLFGNARQHAVPNIVETDLSPAPPTRTAPVTFGFLGRLTEEKGVFDLAAAFGAIQTEARLVVGGRVDQITRAKAQARAGRRAINFLGFVRPADFFAQVDVLVVPSIWSDPCPTVILEAQSAGRPTLGSRRGGIPEAIGSEAAGWTFDPDQPEALRDALDAIAADPMRIEAASAAAMAGSRRFTADVVLAQYNAIYERALAG